MLVLALLLRVWGLSWSLPDTSRYYLYHPDEPVLLHALCSVNPLNGDIAPSFYNYGSFSILLSRLAFDVTVPFLGWGTVPRYDESFGNWAGDMAHLLLVGRAVTVALGILAVWATQRLASQLYGVRTGWLAALFAAVTPGLVVLGHYLTVDVPAACLSTLALLCSTIALRSVERGQPVRWMVAAGALAGLATGTKYNSFFAFLPALVPAWQLWRQGRWSPALQGVVLGGVALVACFVLATPGALQEPELFLSNVTDELVRNREGQGMVFAATPPALLYHLGITLPITLEWPLLLLSLAGIGWAVRKRGPEDWLLLLFVVPFFLALVGAERKFVRYVAPLLPPLVVLAARLLDELAASRRRSVSWGLTAVAVGSALASSVAHVGVFAATDSRDLAAAQLRTLARPEETVALAQDPWFYTPPIHPTAGAVKVAAIPRNSDGGPPVWDRFPRGQRPDLYPLPEFRVLAPRSFPGAPEGPLSVEKLRRYRPRWVVISDYEYEDPVRIRKRDPSFQHPVLDLLAELDREYHLEREVRPRPSLFGFTWWSRGLPPNDWRYPMPALRIYARRETAGG